ncbi:MAG: transglycosylase domain-containing protein, partial [Cloacibacillus evryensis]
MPQIKITAAAGAAGGGMKRQRGGCLKGGPHPCPARRQGGVVVTFPIDAVLDRPASLVVTDKNGVPLRGSLSAAGEWRLPLPPSEMGRWMPAADVALEDRRFYHHAGIDTIAIARAAWQNIAGGRIVSGASTITSQVVRLAVDRPRTPAGKAVEFAQGAALEF